MNGMTSALTRGQKRLALIIILLAGLDMPVFFSVMWRTVTALVAPSFGWQAWTVPLATELTFTVMFLLAVLFEWCRIPARWLWLAPFPFAAASFALNVAGAPGSIPGTIGHRAVTLAFFIPLLVAKTAVRSLLVTDEERARAVGSRRRAGPRPRHAPLRARFRLAFPRPGPAAPPAPLRPPPGEGA